jgi:predicted dehydrogenase
MSEKVRWGILGNATIARMCVIPAIKKSRNGTLHALATRFPERAQQLKVDAGIHRLYDDYGALLADTSIDAVYVPLPNHLHCLWTKKALAAGKHVLCEKPLGCNEREACSMVQAAAEAGLLLMEAFMYRYHPRSLRIKHMIEDDSIGIPRSFRAAFSFSMETPENPPVENIRLQPDLGGGALLDVGCYCVRVSRWLLNAEPTTVQGQAVYLPNGVDVHFLGIMRFPNDLLATIEAGFVTALQQMYMIHGTEGAIELPHDAFIPWKKDTEVTFRKKDREEGKKIVIPGADQYQSMVEAFADAVVGNNKGLLAPEDSIANMRILDALAQAARSGQSVCL